MLECSMRQSQAAIKQTMELNTKYHTPEEIVRIMSELTGEEVDESFMIAMMKGIFDCIDVLCFCVNFGSESSSHLVRRVFIRKASSLTVFLKHFLYRIYGYSFALGRNEQGIFIRRRE